MKPQNNEITRQIVYFTIEPQEDSELFDDSPVESESEGNGAVETQDHSYTRPPNTASEESQNNSKKFCVEIPETCSPLEAVGDKEYWNTVPAEVCIPLKVSLIVFI